MTAFRARLTDGGVPYLMIATTKGPAQHLEFWVLDVQGQRLLIEKTHFPSSPPSDLAELDAVIDSIRTEP